METVWDSIQFEFQHGLIFNICLYSFLLFFTCLFTCSLVWVSKQIGIPTRFFKPYWDLMLKWNLTGGHKIFKFHCFVLFKFQKAWRLVEIHHVTLIINTFCMFLYVVRWTRRPRKIWEWNWTKRGMFYRSMWLFLFIVNLCKVYIGRI